MIEAGALGAWPNLEAKLRPFIVRRVRAGVDVDDIVQDVFLRIQRGLGGLRDEERFGPWVYQIARSSIVDHQRGAAKHRPATEDILEQEVLSVDEDQCDMERELVSHIAPFVTMLPSPYREALTLTELEGLTQKQVADMLGLSLSGMKSRVQRGRQQLRKAFDDCCHIALDARGRVISCEPRTNGKCPNGC